MVPVPAWFSVLVFWERTTALQESSYQPHRSGVGLPPRHKMRARQSNHLTVDAAGQYGYCDSANRALPVRIGPLVCEQVVSHALIASYPREVPPHTASGVLMFVYFGNQSCTSCTVQLAHGFASAQWHRGAKCLSAASGMAENEVQAVNDGHGLTLQVRRKLSGPERRESATSHCQNCCTS